MSDREVTKTGKNKDGDITILGNSSAIWSPKYKSMAILEIEANVHRYFVKIGDDKVDIQVVNDLINGKYLRTDLDKTTSNNLNDLPDC